MNENYVTNPVIPSDFPDPDVIRVNDTYYMASTTMYFMPGGDLLRSYDLLNWELAGHIYDKLESDEASCLENGKNIYSQGMWAPSLRYHNGKFYVVFSCNNTHKTFVFISESPEGKWERHTMEGFYHDSSLLFDDDGKVYIVYGNTELRLTELDPESWSPKKGGLDKIIVNDAAGQPLGYEGSHLYKHAGKYYLFTCHMPAGEKVIKTEDCFIAESLDGEFRGKEIIRDDMGHRGLGVGQGGMVDTPAGEWFLFMFQDRGALGRAPVIMPMRFDGEGYPVPVYEEGKLPKKLYFKPENAGRIKNNLYGSAFLDENGALMPYWQFSHNPDMTLCSFPSASSFAVKTGKLSKNLLCAKNTLTQRCFEPVCEAAVKIDGKDLNRGDTAGLCIFSSAYSAIALKREESGYKLVLLNVPADNASFFGMKDFAEKVPDTLLSLPLEENSVFVKAEADFRGDNDTVRFYYSSDGAFWEAFGDKLPIYFKMDLFTGCRFGLFCFSEKENGGTARFSEFLYKINKNPID